MNLLLRLLKLFKKKKAERYGGCSLCYDSGAVHIPTGNRHFRGEDIHRKCLNGCLLTAYGSAQLRGQP